MSAARHPEGGFSMIEALVAMTVLALGAVALLSATEGHTARIGAVIDRTTARWVAENRLTELRLGLNPVAATEEMLGRQWQIRSELTPTSDPDLQAVEIRVGPDGSDATLVRLDGYLDSGSTTGVVP